MGLAWPGGLAMTRELRPYAMIFTSPNGCEEIIVQSWSADADAIRWVKTMAEQTGGTAVVLLRDGSPFQVATTLGRLMFHCLHLPTIVALVLIYGGAAGRFFIPLSLTIPLQPPISAL